MLAVQLMNPTAAAAAEAERNELGSAQKRRQIGNRAKHRQGKQDHEK